MKKTIAIVAGGGSSEHQVSMRSAAGISSWLDRELFEPYIVEMKKDGWEVHLEDGRTEAVNRHDFTFPNEKGQTIRPDYAYITIHGTPGENGILQGYFELLGIPYSSADVLVSALTFNKFVCNQYLKGFGVKVAESILLRDEKVSPADIVARVGLPCFVKPNGAGSSFGVTKCKTQDDIEAAIEKAKTECDEVLIEAFLDGTELANGVYRTKKTGTVVLPITEVVSENEFFDYDAKYNGQVDEITPARLSDDTTKRVQALTKAIYEILGGRGIMRVDYIITHNEGKDVINLLEINATPGMTATSFIPQQARAAGMEMKQILTDIIQDTL
ncbi:MAG: D-alanine--D-alanine ligase [Bacteroidaceae bacterium]|nr:D-alanine--D-alanine ligase [Bacteroidaceae bacterium]